MAAPGAYGPPPWSDAEKVFLLAELIKQSGPSPQQLLNVLSSMNPPAFRWGDIPLPQGRTLNETMQVWDQLRRNAPSIQPLSILPAGLGTQTPSPLSAPMPLKRPYPFDGMSGREIRPKPSSTPNIYGGQLTQIDQPPKKKRGRPTKQEAAARAEALAMSGESSSGPRALRMSSVASTPIAPGASEATDPSTADPSPAEEIRVALPPPVSRMPISSILTPTAPKSASQSSSSSGKRKRGRSTRSEPENFALSSTSRSMQTQFHEYESPYARMAPQSSTSPARAAAMRHREDLVPPSPLQPPTSQPPPTTSSPEYTRSM